MKAVKESNKESNKVVQGKGFGVSRACGHGQHVLDKHDRDTGPRRQVDCEIPHRLERRTKHSCGNLSLADVF